MKILLVEDNPADARLLREILCEEEAATEIEHAKTLKEAVSLLKEKPFDCVLLDLMLPDESGMDTFRRIYEIAPSPIVVLSGLSDETLAAKAVREGAQDYLVKGHADGRMIIRSLRYSIERHMAKSARRGASPQEGGFIMVGASPAFREVKSLIETVADTTNTTVLLSGETGTGKGVAASAIHYLSERREQPFLKLNCSAIPDTLLEAEMFGYEKGAFTDAKQSKKGLFELADGGTVLLDEIADMDLRLQPKLLHFLENRTFIKLGGLREIKVDVRVAAATNKNLHSLVKEKRFRADLYYRLNVMEIHIPPLRERKEDIIPLSEYFLGENSKNLNKAVPSISAVAKEALLRYDWPGNIRELRNAMERAILLSPSNEITVEGLPLETRTPGITAKPSADMTLEEMEKTHILYVLSRADGNKTQASKILGISRLTLREKLKKYADKG